MIVHSTPYINILSYSLLAVYSGLGIGTTEVQRSP